MRRKRATPVFWTAEEDKFLKDYYLLLLDREIGEALGRTPEQVKGHRQWLGLIRGKNALRDRMERHGLLTEEQENFLAEHNEGVSSEAMAALLNAEFGLQLTGSQIRTFRKNHKLPCGRDTHFRKGNVPWTKGKTMEEVCKGDPDKMANARRNCYRKGNVPSNKVPIGTVLEKTDGYLWVKVKDDPSEKYTINNWRLLHRKVWEDANGPIPSGGQIVFLNGDRKDVRLENLSLMTNRERGFFKGLPSEDPEMQKLAVSIVKIKARVAERKRRDEEQDHRPE